MTNPFAGGTTSILEPEPIATKTPLARQLEVTFYNKDGAPVVTPMSLEEPSATADITPTLDTTVYETADKYVTTRATSTEFKLCHINNVPDTKTEIVYRTVKVLGKKIRVPTVALRKRFCDTDFIVTFTVAEERLAPILLECAVVAAVPAAAIIISGCLTGPAAPAAVAAGLEVFEASVAQCIASRGFSRELFDLKLEQRKSCSAWEPMI